MTITPDGPRGPRRRLALGPIYLASKLQLPLVAMGFDRPWRVNSGDRFAVPRPFCRARAVVSGRLRIPPQLDRQATEQHRLEVERMLNRLTVEAEAQQPTLAGRPPQQAGNRSTA